MTAASPAVQVSVVNCDETWMPGGPPLPDGGPVLSYYAVQAYPGLTAAQIAGHVTNWTSTTGIPGPSGFTLRAQDAIYVQDGLIGAGCAGPTSTSTFIYAPGAASP